MSNGPASNKKLSEAITKTLPFLRRYARAVTGSQQRGDEWVRLCAEVAVRQPQPEVHIRGDREGRYEFVGRVVFNCQRAGILKIGFITEPPPRFGG